MSRSQTPKNDSKCEGMLKDDTRCAFNGKHAHDGKYFCGVHYKQKTTPSEPKPPICEGQTKCAGRCVYVGKYTHQDKHYCATHYKKAAPTRPIPPPPPAKPTRPTPPAKPTRPTPPAKPKASADISPTDSLLEIVHSFLKLRIGDLPKADRKKRGREILLKIHPDKCRIPNIDAHGLTQKVLAHMQQ
jgi:hypothetical protein